MLHSISPQALALCRYLEGLSTDFLSGKKVIELGAGTGLVGLVAHALGEVQSAEVLSMFDSSPPLLLPYCLLIIPPS